MPIKTDAVRRQVITDARKSLKQAAGANGKLDAAETKTLDPDLKKAVVLAKKELGRNPTVAEAVTAYTKYVGKVLGAVDGNNRGAGILSEAEVKKIGDPALRGRIHDVRARLATPADGPGPVNAGKLNAVIEDMQGEWGSENIMDGMVALQTSIVVGGSVKRTAEREMDALVTDGNVDELVGARAVSGPRKAAKADIEALAKAINDDGFQYASDDEHGRIKGQIESILKQLGGPAGLELAVVKQDAKALFISDTDTFPTQVHTFLNGKTGDAVSFFVRKGSL